MLKVQHAQHDSCHLRGIVDIAYRFARRGRQVFKSPVSSLSTQGLVLSCLVETHLNFFRGFEYDPTACCEAIVAFAIGQRSLEPDTELGRSLKGRRSSRLFNWGLKSGFCSGGLVWEIFWPSGSTEVFARKERSRRVADSGGGVINGPLPGLSRHSCRGWEDRFLSILTTKITYLVVMSPTSYNKIAHSTSCMQVCIFAAENSCFSGNPQSHQEQLDDRHNVEIKLNVPCVGRPSLAIMTTDSTSNANGAPQQHKQPSRKGKKAWRKNVDITQIQVGLGDAREQTIQGQVALSSTDMAWLR